MTDHPRIRGEHLPDDVRFNVDGGSSPHTRGARSSPWPGGPARGIIPAYAGSTHALGLRRRGDRDHPRIRGEHGRDGESGRSSTGSSPHTRGAPGSSSPARRRRGIIPAYAGSTLIPCSRATSSSDHPRIRGEHLHFLTSIPSKSGSSPHTRGAQRYAQSTYSLDRIIPAYAGSTRKDSRNDTRFPDHPRIRGEHCRRRLGA